jgi:hypothetical protein
MRTFVFRFLALWIICSVILFSAVLYGFYSEHSSWDTRQFSEQAWSFLHGKTAIAHTVDTVRFHNQYYWYSPPFPSFILLVGFVLSKQVFTEPVGQFYMLIPLVYFLYKLARSKRFGKVDSFYLTFVFLFGSVMINLITQPISWYFSQVVATTLLVVLLYEFETKRRYWVLGLCEGALIATRPTAGFIGVLLAWLLFKTFLKRGITKQLIVDVFSFFLPICISILFLLWFNYVRFGSAFFDTYHYLDAGVVLRPVQQLGVFSLRHVPSSFYYFFLASYLPVTKGTAHLVFPYITYSPFGLSFFLVCPFFVYAFRTLKRAAFFVRAYWLVILGTLGCLLCFFSMGGFQTYGPRYTADFLPILYVLLLTSFKKPRLNNVQKFLILLSSSLNVYLLLTHFVH